nr:hypothetical protein [Lachnospiraceae bacterium]
MNQAKSETTTKDTIDIFDEFMSDSLKEASSQSVPINNISTTDSFVVKESKARLPINQPKYIPGFYKSTVSKYLRDDFNKEIRSFKASSGIITGYPNLDAIIGSLYP